VKTEGRRGEEREGATKVAAWILDTWAVRGSQFELTW
jgi:hypothetical protein